MKNDAQRAYIRGLIAGKKSFNRRSYLSGVIMGIVIGYSIMYYLPLIKQLF